MIKSKYEINTKILKSNEKYLNEGLLKKEEIEDDITGLSLTPKKSLIRKFFSFESGQTSLEKINPVSSEEKLQTQSFSIFGEGVKPFIPMEVNTKLESFVMTKGLPKKSIMERLELELNDKFFIESKEKIYISNYNKIAGSCNVKTEKPFVFFDECEGISRFGINNHNTQEIAQSFNGALFSIIKINEDNIKPSGNKLLNTNDKGGKSQSNKSNDQAVLNYDNFKTLHPLETLLFKEALGYMLSEKNKSILVDIFERDKSGYIDISDKDKPKTHTVVLCREDFSNNNFLVIDPSNSEFSKHFGLLGVNNILSMELEKEINIFVSPVNYKIYEQNKDIGTGYAFNKFRDCVDIAFKLAKKINEEPAEKVTFSAINNKIFEQDKANLIIKVITNNKDLDNNIDQSLCTEKFFKYPLRGKQLNNEPLGQKLYKEQLQIYNDLNNLVRKIVDTDIEILARKKIQEYFVKDEFNKESITNFLDNLYKTIESQNNTKKLWDIFINDDKIDVDILNLSGELHQSFEKYYNES